jgi:hypothetical protein
MRSNNAERLAYYELVCPPITDGQGHAYHGVARLCAPMTDGEKSLAKDVWEEYYRAPWEDLGEWDIFFPSLSVARDFQLRFRERGESFDLIAIYHCESAADVTAVERLPGYVGLDVCNTEPNSALYPEVLWKDIDYTSDRDSLLALWALPPMYFRTRVNQWGLLTTYDDAAFLRDIMRALEKIDATHQTLAY